MMVLLSAPEDEDGDDDDDDDDDDDGVDFTDVTLVYKDANQHKAHKIILSWPEHTSYLSRTHGRCPCKFFLPGVNFYRFNAKNWQFTVYFAVITQKIGNLLCSLS